MKFCVIGLGRLGFQVATTLSENGMEVMAVDSNESIIASIRDKVTQAVCMRVTDENSLRSIGIEEMNTIIVAMGENFAQSILITAILKKKLKAPYVIARAINEIHSEILQLVGADRHILPEKEIGIKIADKLSSPFMDLIRLDDDFSISQVMAPPTLVGKTIANIHFFEQYAVHCIGIKKDKTIQETTPDYTIEKADKLILAGMNKYLEKFAR